MIKTIFYKTRSDGINLYRTYSDEDVKIYQNQTGVIFESAVDVENSGFTYSETDEKIITEVSAEEVLNLILGGNGS